MMAREGAPGVGISPPRERPQTAHPVESPGDLRSLLRATSPHDRPIGSPPGGPAALAESTSLGAASREAYSVLEDLLDECADRAGLPSTEASASASLLGTAQRTAGRRTGTPSSADATLGGSAVRELRPRWMATSQRALSRRPLSAAAGGSVPWATDGWDMTWRRAATSLTRGGGRHDPEEPSLGAPGEGRAASMPRYSGPGARGGEDAAVGLEACAEEGGGEGLPRSSGHGGLGRIGRYLRKDGIETDAEEMVPRGMYEGRRERGREGQGWGGKDGVECSAGTVGGEGEGSETSAGSRNRERREKRRRRGKGMSRLSTMAVDVGQGGVGERSVAGEASGMLTEVMRSVQWGRGYPMGAVVGTVMALLGSYARRVLVAAQPCARLSALPLLDASDYFACACRTPTTLPSRTALQGLL